MFYDNEDRQFYLNLLKKYINLCRCKAHVYCLMPNHVHLLLVPAEENSLAKTMQKLSLSYTQHINRKYKRSGRLWECRFFSAIVDKESYLWAVCRYIEQNPLRAGIAKKAIEYFWSSARINCGLSKSDFVEPIWKEYLNKDRYQTLLAEGIKDTDLKKIRESSTKGIPLGSKEFLDKMVDKFGRVVIPNPKGHPRKSRHKK